MLYLLDPRSVRDVVVVLIDELLGWVTRKAAGR